MRWGRRWFQIATLTHSLTEPVSKLDVIPDKIGGGKRWLYGWDTVEEQYHPLRWICNRPDPTQPNPIRRRRMSMMMAMELTLYLFLR